MHGAGRVGSDVAEILVKKAEARIGELTKEANRLGNKGNDQDMGIIL